MHKCATILTIVGVLLGATLHGHSEGSTSELELPDISAIANIQALTTDAEDDPNDERIRVKEVELGVQGCLNPSVRGDLIVVFEHEYLADDDIETEIHIEEAYVSFLGLPGGFQAQIGRKLMGFGRLNPIHPHHWAFADTPPALENLFGSHAWSDDGAELIYLIPSPADIRFRLAVGVWNGKEIGHAHDHGEAEPHVHDAHGHDEEDHEDEDHDEHDESDPGHPPSPGDAGEHGDVIDWDGRVFTGRASADLPLTDRLSAQAGYSVAGDEGNNLLHGADFVLSYRWPQTYRRVRWHTEWFHYDRDDDGAAPSGLFSLFQVTLDEYWELGGRYDWTEFLEDDKQDTWAGSGFLTRHLTPSTYVRGQYQYREHNDGEEENIVTVQLVWGIGRHQSTAAPHSECVSPGCSSCSQH